MSALQNNELLKKPEYYCVVQRYNGVPVRNALTNPTGNSPDSFDVFYGPYYGDDGIRPQLLELSEKGGKSFKDQIELTKYFQKHFGFNTQISIFDATRGEIIFLGGNGESSGEITKPELNRLPPIYLNPFNVSSEDQPHAVPSFKDNRASKKASPWVKTKSELNRTPTNFKSAIDAHKFKPNKWRSYDGSSVTECLDVHGMFGTVVPTSRSLVTQGAVTGAAQAKPANHDKRKNKWF